MTFPKTCEAPGCDATFHAERASKRFCDDRCRKRASRATQRPGESIVHDLTTRLRLVQAEPAGPQPGDPTEPFSVMSALQGALCEVSTDDALTRFYKAQAVTLATVLDDPSKSNQWKGITQALEPVLVKLVGVQKAAGDKSDALQEMISMINGTNA